MRQSQAADRARSQAVREDAVEAESPAGMAPSAAEGHVAARFGNPTAISNRWNSDQALRRCAMQRNTLVLMTAVSMAGALGITQYASGKNSPTPLQAARKTIESSLATGVAVPPSPVVRAVMRGSRIVIHYRFKTWPSAPDRRPLILITSVASADPRMPRLTKQTILKQRTGTIIQRRGLGRRPFRVVYSVLSRKYTRSDTRSVRVSDSP